ncbi:amidohydrolase family protein [Aulographum hederae CBS 113979]|uniref:6-methylsalicylate decarboxylase n=1 Tax=Aulographum hederae CBS 113979 TaxID=1176131 RepID=A0A6G1GNR0_9PEZI|nr:amidohydrolase family protein [Aulographum hederae CBS 113979]
MPDHVYDWLVNDKLGWPAKPPAIKLDTHHHFVPKFYADAVESAGGDPSGWATPRWTPYSSELMMDRLGIQKAVISCTSPGACVLKGQASFDLARKLNEEAAAIRDANPKKFAFFANLPDLLDQKESLAEISFAMDKLGADGVCLFSRYGDSHTYLGHPDLEPIWEELNRRSAVVFVHPTSPVDPGRINKVLSQPVVDYPHETTRTAMDMITAGTLRKFPNCKVILSHGGGTLPWLIARAATPLRKSPEFGPSYLPGTTFDSFMADFRRFYFDLALSATTPNLNMLLEMVPHGQILYGSDFPYPPAPAHPALLEQLEEHPMEKETRDKIYFENAMKLIPSFAEGK